MNNQYVFAVMIEDDSLWSHGEPTRWCDMIFSTEKLAIAYADQLKENYSEKGFEDGEINIEVLQYKVANSLA